MNKLKILVFANLTNPIHSQLRYFLMEMRKHAHVQIWSKGRWEINYVLKVLKKRGGFVPDFIFHYDFAYDYAISPRIYGLSYTGIPKGVYYFDLQTQTEERKEFVYKNKINLVFSPTKDFFFRMLPELKDKFRWLPFSINPGIFKDWQLQKNIDFLLMGNLWNAGEKYAREINRAKIFFTCGTKFNYPITKYFEVPACNTLLIAKGNKDLEELGFVKKENFVECNDDNFYDLAMYYLKHEEERKRIAINGYDLVHSRHTNSTRAVEFINTIKSYLDSNKNSNCSGSVNGNMNNLNQSL